MLDANVEVTTSILSRRIAFSKATFIDARSFPSEEKADSIKLALAALASGTTNQIVFSENPSVFDYFPNAVIGYDFPSFLRKAFNSLPSLVDSNIRAYKGQSFPLQDNGNALELVGLLNTPLVRFSLNRFCGQHK